MDASPKPRRRGPDPLVFTAPLTFQRFAGDDEVEKALDLLLADPRRWHPQLRDEAYLDYVSRQFARVYGDGTGNDHSGVGTPGRAGLEDGSRSGRGARPIDRTIEPFPAPDGDAVARATGGAPATLGGLALRAPEPPKGRAPSGRMSASEPAAPSPTGLQSPAGRAAGPGKPAPSSGPPHRLRPAGTAQAKALPGLAPPIAAGAPIRIPRPNVHPARAYEGPLGEAGYAPPPNRAGRTGQPAADEPVAIPLIVLQAALGLDPTGRWNAHTEDRLREILAEDYRDVHLAPLGRTEHRDIYLAQFGRSLMYPHGPALPSPILPDFGTPLSDAMEWLGTALDVAMSWLPSFDWSAAAGVLLGTSVSDDTLMAVLPRTSVMERIPSAVLAGLIAGAHAASPVTPGGSEPDPSLVPPSLPHIPPQLPGTDIIWTPIPTGIEGEFIHIPAFPEGDFDNGWIVLPGPDPDELLAAGPLLLPATSPWTESQTTTYRNCLRRELERRGETVVSEHGGGITEHHIPPVARTHNRSPLLGSSYADVAIVVARGVTYIINHFTPRADGMPDSREMRQLGVMVNNANAHRRPYYLLNLPKVPEGHVINTQACAELMGRFLDGRLEGGRTAHGTPVESAPADTPTAP